jgi:hypothetical protein
MSRRFKVEGRLLDEEKSKLERSEMALLEKLNFVLEKTISNVFNTSY